MIKRILLGSAFLTLLLVWGLSPLTLMAQDDKEDKDEKGPKVMGSIAVEKGTKETALPGLAKVSFKKALDLATTAVPGKVLKAELESENDTLIYSIEIVDKDSEVTEVNVDAGNGKILSTDKEKDEKDEKDEQGDKEEKD